MDIHLIQASKIVFIQDMLGKRRKNARHWIKNETHLEADQCKSVKVSSILTWNKTDIDLDLVQSFLSRAGSVVQLIVLFTREQSQELLHLKIHFIIGACMALISLFLYKNIGPKTWSISFQLLNNHLIFC